MSVPSAAEFQVYATIHEQIARAIAGLSPEQLQATPLPGEWSIQQIVIHLTDGEVIGYERLRRVIAEDHPSLQPYDEEAWTRNLFYHQQDLQLAQELFALLRRASLRLLQQLPPAAWERSGLHADNGEKDLYALFQAYLQHGVDHLHQIERLRQHLDV